jgi:hypothetical protein
MKTPGLFTGTAGSGGLGYRSKFPNDERFTSERPATGLEHGFEADSCFVIREKRLIPHGTQLFAVELTA